MRIVPLVLAILFVVGAAFASEIREFDLKTIERLGNELTRVSQTRDKGATTPVRKRARETAIAALQGKLFNIRYDYVVLDDPDGSGFLVYALAATGKPNEQLFGGDVRVTISGDGATVHRVDHAVGLMRTTSKPPVPGATNVSFATYDPTSKIPSETYIYRSNVYHLPVFIGTRDGSYWLIANGKMRKFSKAELDALEKEKKK